MSADLLKQEPAWVRVHQKQEPLFIKAGAPLSAGSLKQPPSLSVGLWDRVDLWIDWVWNGGPYTPQGGSIRAHEKNLGPLPHSQKRSGATDVCITLIHMDGKCFTLYTNVRWWSVLQSIIGTSLLRFYFLV